MCFLVVGINLTFRTRTLKKQREICFLLKGWREREEQYFLLHCKSHLLNTRCAQSEAVQTFTPTFQGSHRQAKRLHSTERWMRSSVGVQTGWRSLTQAQSASTGDRAGADQARLGLPSAAPRGGMTASHWKLPRCQHRRNITRRLGNCDSFHQVISTVLTESLHNVSSSVGSRWVSVGGSFTEQELARKETHGYFLPLWFWGSGITESEKTTLLSLKYPQWPTKY